MFARLKSYRMDIIAFPFLQCRFDVGTLLQAHRSQILDDDDGEASTRRITVRRKHLLEDTMKSLRRTPWESSKHLKVVFIGEPGVDDGGPRREYFRLLLAEIGNNNSFLKVLRAEECHIIIY